MDTELVLARYPLTQLAGMSEKWYRRPSLPKRDDVQAEVNKALSGEIKAAPAPQFARDMLPAFKDYMRDLNLQAYWLTLAEEWSKTNPTMMGGAQRAIEILQYLQENLPNEVEMTVAGMRKTLGSSFSEDSKFLWKCQLAEEPMRFVDLLGTRMLAASDVECMSIMYPNLYNEIVKDAIEFVTENYSDMANPLPRVLQAQLSILLGAPIIKPEQLQAYKDYDAKSAQDKANPPSSTSPSISQNEAI